jgi:hypothetical protein
MRRPDEKEQDPSQAQSASKKPVWERNQYAPPPPPPPPEQQHQHRSIHPRAYSYWLHPLHTVSGLEAVLHRKNTLCYQGPSNKKPPSGLWMLLLAIYLTESRFSTRAVVLDENANQGYPIFPSPADLSSPKTSLRNGGWGGATDDNGDTQQPEQRARAHCFLRPQGASWWCGSSHSHRSNPSAS